MSSKNTDGSKFSSHNIQLVAVEKPHCVVEFTITTTPQFASEQYKKALKEVSKHVSIPGFRKGKAPDSLIEKKFEKSLLEEWHRAISSEAFKEALSLTKIHPLQERQQPRMHLDMKSCTKSDGAELVIQFEREPAVPSVDVHKVHLKEIKEGVVDEKRVDETVDQIRSFFGKWVDIEGRSVEENDHVSVDVDIVETTPPERALSNVRFRVNRANMAKWMHDIIIGMNIGQSREALSTPDEDAPEEFKKESPAKQVRVTLLAIQKQELPPLDDSLAALVGAPSYEEMRTRLHSLLVKQTKENARHEQRNHVAEELLEHFPFEIPASLVDRETQFRLRQLAQDPSFQKDFKKMTDADKKAKIEEVKKHAERSVRLFYLCREVCTQHQISLDPKELKRSVDTPLDAMFTHPDDLYNYDSLSQEQQAMALSRLMLEKAEDYVIDHLESHHHAH